MKFGIVGLGNHAINRVMPAIASTGNRITAIYSRKLEKAQKEGKNYNATPFDDLSAMLKNGDFDAVYIASPNFMHHEQAKRAMENGKHVLLEKQMTLTLKDASDLVKISEKLNLVLALGFHMRFHPAIQEIREMAQSGALGNVTSIRGSWGGLSGRTEEDPDRQWWRDEEKAGGGSVMGTGVHVIDTINFILGKKPGRVAAFRNPPGKVLDQTESVLMDYDGIIASAISSRAIARPLNDLVVEGTSNSVRAAGVFGTQVNCKVYDSENVVIREYAPVNMYEREVMSFVSRTEGKNELIASGRDGEEVVRIVTEAFDADKRTSYHGSA